MVADGFDPLHCTLQSDRGRKETSRISITCTENFHVDCLVADIVYLLDFVPLTYHIWCNVGSRISNLIKKLLGASTRI